MNKEIVNQTGKWRWIVELSSMINNQEIVAHLDVNTNWKEFYHTYSSIFAKYFASPDFAKPSLATCRPVFQREINEGLDVSYLGSTFKEKPPHITQILDGMWKLVDDLKTKLHLYGSYKESAFSPTNLINEIVAYNYFDCMSSFMPAGMILGCRYIIKHYGCDLTKECYPNKDEWYTLGDFMELTKHHDALIDELTLPMESFVKMLPRPSQPGGTK